MAKKDLLNSLTQKELLAMPLNQLKVDLKNSWIFPLINKLYKELEQKNIKLKPKIWVADDWFSPDGSAGFALPFYLLHPRLMRLEKKYIHEIEGHTKLWCMKLLRHETAHCLDNAYHLRKLKVRQQIFGLTSKKYPKSYLPIRGDKNFVHHLQGSYAQAHPDEDFAETFAVWLDPKSNWENKYASWPVINKLNYIDEIMQEVAYRKIKNRSVEKINEIKSLDHTLADYFFEKRNRLKINLQKNINSRLTKEFSANRRNSTQLNKLLTRNRQEIKKSLSLETKQQQYKIDLVLEDLISLSKKRNLQFRGKENRAKERIKKLIRQNIDKSGNTARIIM